MPKPSNQPSTPERDPVCGMNVNPATAKHVYEHGWKNYYFCCASCAEKFKADPQKYLSGPPPAKASGLVMLGAAQSAPPTALESVHRDQPPQAKDHTHTHS
ncbi:MAG: YHS domain-containing protein, partial [Candidatus Sulfotelmatobacter sp.]